MVKADIGSTVVVGTALEEANRTAGTTLAYHGGGLEAARRRFPEAPEPWLDLSTGINALPYPVGALSAAAFSRLPEASSIASLEAAAARAFSVGGAAEAIAAPGTQSLIQILPRLLPARTVAILGFTYAEHEHVWAASGAEVKTFENLEDLAAADVAIVVNPNNPDGRLVNVDDLRTLARKMAAQGKTVIVDEAFIDFLPPEASIAPHLPALGLIVLRSFGKTFGLAGLRLGFALCDPEMAARLRGALGPWAVSGAAVEIGARAYADRQWLMQSAARLEVSAARLDALLRDAGLEILGGTPLFRLARHAQAATLFHRLGAGGVLVRPFAARPEWLRFGIPQEEQEFIRLEKLLRDA
jgi:cobalamin biosynthetic protein CobC